MKRYRFKFEVCQEWKTPVAVVAASEQEAIAMLEADQGEPGDSWPGMTTCRMVCSEEVESDCSVPLGTAKGCG
jgi:hypothetical protein